MRCQECGSSEATVAYTEVTEAGSRTLYLCERCTESRRGGRSPGAAPQPQAPHQAGVTVELRRAKQEREPGPRCPNCGTTYEEFRKRGRFGCQECYESFGPELDRLIKRVHGADQHRGKRPGARRRPQGAAGGGVAELRQALARAVAAEQYELAAELRDQMRALQEAAGTGDADGRSAGSEVR